MLDAAISACPERLWSAALWEDSEDPRYGQFWSVAYHTLFWLDLYLHGSFEGFAPPAPFLSRGLPEKPYTKEEIRTYLSQCRRKCQSLIERLTDEQAYEIRRFNWMEPSFVELQLYSMRHVQEHAAQLSLLLGQHGIAGPDWVAKARE
ncbi:MAG: DinB family protein [Anaerolineae bacterium]|nr:DinB family protein [Anaerolineae bacterium]